MSYSYGVYGPSGGRYGERNNGGSYMGGVQEYERNRQVGSAPYGGDGAYGVYSGDRGYGGNNWDTPSRGVGIGAHLGGYGAGVNVGGGGSGGYGQGYDYEREYRRTSRNNRNVGPVGVYGGGYGGSKSSRHYRDTDRNFKTYRNKQRDVSTSSSSSSDDENRPGIMDKIKGAFGYGPAANNNNQYDNQYNNNNASYGPSRREYSTKSYSKNNKTGNYGAYGGSYGGYGQSYGGNYGNNDIVTLRSKREAHPQFQEESGNKSLLWQVGVQGFDLDDIRVTDAGNNKVEISGHAEDVGPHHRRTKQFTRIITLPEGANAKEVKSRISGNGLLTITVPYTGKGLKDYGTRELTLGQGSTTTGRTGTATTGSYNSSSNKKDQDNFATGGQQYHQTTTQTTQRTSANA